MLNFRIKTLALLLLIIGAISVLKFASVFFQSPCELPSAIKKNLIKFEEIAIQVEQSMVDSSNLSISHAYEYDEIYGAYGLKPKKEWINVSLSPIEKELINFGITMIAKKTTGDIFFYYFYSNDDYFKKTWKALIFQNEPVDYFSNTEGDASYEVICNEMATKKLRHVIETEEM